MTALSPAPNTGLLGRKLGFWPAQLLRLMTGIRCLRTSRLCCLMTSRLWCLMMSRLWCLMTSRLWCLIMSRLWYLVLLAQFHEICIDSPWIPVSGRAWASSRLSVSELCISHLAVLPRLRILGPPPSSGWSMEWSYLLENERKPIKDYPGKKYSCLRPIWSLLEERAGDSYRNVLFPFRSLLLHICKYAATWASVLVCVGTHAEIQSHYLAIKVYTGSGASLCKTFRAILKSKEAANYCTANLTITKERSFTSPVWEQKAFASGRSR